MDTALPEQIELQVVTPEHVAVSATVKAVSLPGADGRLGVLPGHAPLVSELRAGTLSYQAGGSSQALAISAGFVEVLPGRVIVLASEAEKAENIDVPRAQESKRRAEEALKKAGASEAEVEAARAAIELSEARIEAAGEATRR
ncbi:MAG: F0F1 ATP synthase subunit epsilon [Terriglobia bacterium]